MKKLILVPFILACMVWFPDQLAFAFKYLSLTFIYFAFVVWLKYAAIRNGFYKNKVIRAIFYVFAGDFIRRDVISNIILSPLFVQLPNHYGEGWTVTSRVKAIRRYMTHKLDPSSLDFWRLTLADWFCEQLNAVEQSIGGKDHC